jgi:hypothetical protein
MEPIKPMKPLEFKQLDQWWPHALGNPNSAGSQNGVQYAYFHDVRRLLLRRGGEVSTFDTGDHNISGVSQASDSQHVTFTSTQGLVDLAQLKRL